MPVAAERPAFLLSSAYSVAAVRPSILTLSLFPLVTLMDAMRSLDDFLLRGSVTLASRDLGRSRVTCHRTAYLYVSRYLSRDFYTSMPESRRPVWTLRHAVQTFPYVTVTSV